MKKNPNNYCIIMAGGFGSRFWPICSLTKPKQFLDLLGTGESMIQNTFRRFETICPRENIFIVTTKAHESMVRRQIPDLGENQVLCEPFRRNTAPCIAYAASVIAGINPNANVVVTPSDHAIFGEQDFCQNLSDAMRMIDSHDWIEKPPLDMACQFIASGEFLWNAGIFVWRLPVLMEAYRKHLPQLAATFFNLTLDTPAKQLREVYTQAENISVDYGIIEKADNVYVMEADFGWSDVETWESLFEAKPKDDNGNAISSGRVLTYDTHNCVVHLNSEKYAVIQGLDNYIIAAGTDTLLICPRDQEEQIFKFASDVEMKKMMSKK